MKLTGPACAEAMNEAEEAERRERAEDSAGGVRVELRVRPMPILCSFSAVEMKDNPDEHQGNGGSRKANEKEKEGWESGPTTLCMAE
jgi:hypothetical protein